jgi:hypothetical protein
MDAVELSPFLDSLKHVGSSPYAFAAYIAVVAAWVYLITARHRLGKISELLKDLPPEDRAQVILKEYSILPRSGLSAEQWIKSRQHSLLFFAFLTLIVCVTIVVIVALASAWPPQHSDSRAESSAISEFLRIQVERTLTLERDLAAMRAQVAQLKAQVEAPNRRPADAQTLALMRDVVRQNGYDDPQIQSILADPFLSDDGKVTLVGEALIKRLDKEIAEQAKHLEELRRVANSPGLDVETMKLKRLIDRRAQQVDLLRERIDKYNRTAKAIIDSMGR